MSLGRLGRLIAVIAGYMVLFIYTMAFPGTSSWFILLFFGLVLVGLWLSSLVLRRDISVEPTRLTLVSWFPLLLPDIVVRVENMETQMPALLRRRFPLAMKLPRGHYSELAVETSGLDFFGFYRHHTKKRVRVVLDIYPERLPVHHLTNHPRLRAYLKTTSPELRQLRDYMPEDALKHVDWKASFRRDKLMVKEYERELEPRVQLVFVGHPSAHFEKLLALTYSAQAEWQDKAKVQVTLVGGDSFLTIQPVEDREALLSEWRHLPMNQGMMVVFAPETIAEELRQTRSEPFLLFTDGGDLW